MASASNASIPASAPVTVQVPPLPTTTRGEACALDGTAGRLNEGKGVLCYASGKLCIVRSLTDQALPNSKHSVLSYRGHQFATSCVKVRFQSDTGLNFVLWQIVIGKIEQFSLHSSLAEHIGNVRCIGGCPWQASRLGVGS